MFDTVFHGNHFARGAAIAIIILLSVAVLVVPYLISNMRSEVKQMKQRFKPPKWTRILLYILLIAGVIFYLLPIYMLVATSLKSYAEVKTCQPCGQSRYSHKYP